MRNQRLASHNSAAPRSPATISLVDQIVETPKYWSSERVPYSNYNTRRQVNASALLPFSCGRTLPSKWDDADRWISSPIMCQQQGGNHSSISLQIVQSQRRAKSKSGPLGPHTHTFANYGNCSPLMPVLLHGEGSMAVDSPLLGTSVGGCGGRRSCPGQSEHELSCTRDWLELLSEPRLTSSHDDRSDGNKDPDTRVTPDISGRDISTHMLPPPKNSSAGSSPTTNHSYPASSSPPPPLPISTSNQSTETDVVMIRDVKVDKEDTSTTRRARKHGRKMRRNRSLASQDFSDAAHEFQDSPRSTTESQIAITKLQKEEAKINAWENLQKAKAEAAIREVEMKLEKKRSNSVDKILKKLKKAQTKAEKMRSSLSDEGRTGYRRKTTRRVDWLCWKIRTSSIGSCITS